MLKLNVGFNRKVGEANYGSRGASVNLELELDSGLVGDPDRLKDRVRQMFLLAKAVSRRGAVRHQRGGQQWPCGQRQGPVSRKHPPCYGQPSAGMHTIAERQGFNLTGVLSDQFSVSDPTALSITQASQLIDDLKKHANGNGAGGRRLIAAGSPTCRTARAADTPRLP